MLESITWSHKARSNLSTLLDSRTAALGILIGVTGMSVVGLWLAIHGGLTLFGAATPFICFLAPIVTIAAGYILAAQVATEPAEDNTIVFGQDGIAVNSQFVAWREVVRVALRRRPGGEKDLILITQDYEQLVLRSVPTRLVQKVDEEFANFTAHSNPPALGAETEDYRRSPHAALVRLASNPKAAAETRIRAAEKLRSTGQLTQDVKTALEESLDPVVQAFLKGRG